MMNLKTDRLMNQVVEPKKRKIIKKLNNTARITFLSIVIFFLYFPILIIILQSVNANGRGDDFGGFTLRWYSEMFSDEDLMRAILTTIIIALVATTIATILGTLFAIGINSLNNKRRKQMILLNNVPILNADVVTGVSLFFIFKFFGIIIGNEFILGYGTMLIAHVFFCMPYVLLSVLPKLNEIDNNLYDAALDLGCNPRRALSKVIIPSIKTGILTGMFLAFAMSFDDFVISYMVSGAEVDNFSMWIYTNQKLLSRSLPWPKAYAYNAVVSILSLIILVIYNVIAIKKQKKSRKVSAN